MATNAVDEGEEEGSSSSGGFVKQTSSLAEFGNRKLLNPDDVFSHNAWDQVEWTVEQETRAAAQVAQQTRNHLPTERQAEYENNASRYWDHFYDKHENKFFKDRHWLGVEFPELVTIPTEVEKFTAMEVGCGVGNTVFPLLIQVSDPRLFVWACDFSSTAINIVKNSSLFEPARCSAFVCDIANDTLSPPVPAGSVDVAVMIFVLSALHPDKFHGALRKIYDVLKPGGLLLFRDYGRYDMAQLRFKERAVLANNFYVRGDGTRVFFFHEDEAKTMFEQVGFTVEEHGMDRRLIVNRKSKVQMYRMWLQGKYRKPLC